MGWRRLLSWAVTMTWLALVGGAAVTGNGVALVFLAVSMLGFVPSALNRLRWRGLQAALVAGDAARARALWRRVYSRLDERSRRHPRVQLWRAYVAVLGGHFRPALQILDELTKVKLPAREQAARDSLRARCLAHGPAPESAIAVVNEARALPELSPATKRALTEAVAIARLRLRQPELALAAVDELLADPERIRARASYLVVRGDALRLIGREGEARQAYDEALRISEQGTATWRRARERLDQTPPSVYR